MNKSVWVEPRTKPDTYSIRWYDPISGEKMRLQADGKEDLKKKVRSIEDRLDAFKPGVGDPKAIPLVVMESYLTHCLTRPKPCRRTTVEMKRSNLTPFLETLFTMESLTTESIQLYITSLQQLNRAVDTIAIRLRDIRAFVRWAHKTGILGANVFEGIGIPESHFVGRRLTKEELQAVFSAMSGNLLDFIGLKFETGARRGDLLQMEFKDIDFDERCWLLPGREGKSKSKRDRIIPLGRRALDTLEKRRKQSTGSFVFQGYTKNMLQNDWGNALDAAKVVGRVRPHDMRHTWASNFKGNRNTLKAVAGWTSDLMANKYQHVDLEDLREGMEKTSKHLGQILGQIGAKPNA